MQVERHVIRDKIRFVLRLEPLRPVLLKPGALQLVEFDTQILHYGLLRFEVLSSRAVRFVVQ